METKIDQNFMGSMEFTLRMQLGMKSQTPEPAGTWRARREVTGVCVCVLDPGYKDSEARWGWAAAWTSWPSLTPWRTSICDENKAQV